MHFSVLNAHVANETIKRVNGSSCGVENKHIIKEKDEMWGVFGLSIIMSAFFCIAPFSDPFMGWLFNLLYIVGCLTCFLGVYSVHWNEKQTKTTIKTSLVLSAILLPILMMPIFMNIDTQVNFHVCVGGFGTEGNMHYIYKDYTNYSGVIMFGISIVFCILGMLRPLYHLYKMGK